METPAPFPQSAHEQVEKLLPLVYEDLKRLAGGFFRRERAGHTLQPTALVHEAWLRLSDQREVPWQSKTHFLAIAGKMMRRVLVDYARGHDAQFRGGGWQRIELADDLSVGEDRGIEILNVNAALEKLEQLDPEQAHVVELRFFSGLSVEETAAYLGISTATVKRYWQSARAFLFREMNGGRAVAPPPSQPSSSR
jgi:RNA polymerase sigma-70 factor (ECF subfamily)